MSIDGTETYPRCELCGHTSEPADGVTSIDGIWCCEDWTQCGQRIEEQLSTDPLPFVTEGA